MEVSSLPRGGGGFLPHPRRVLKAFGDDRLVEQIRRGNEAAFEVVYERHHRGILSFCRHMLSSQEEAEDALQQTFVSAYYDLRRGEKDINLKPWLYTIARNRSLSILRARREQPAEIHEIPTAGLAEEVQQRDDLRRMLADVHGLPVEQRAALVLSELGDLAHADIAAVLGCPTLKVKSLVFQARSSLLESREARETSCTEIRQQLATLRGGALRRGPLRKHLSTCPGCREFREEVRRQRTAMAALLPVVPSTGLKGAVMAAIGGTGAAGGGAAGIGLGTAAVAGGGAAASGSAGVGGVIALVSGAGTVKVVAAVVLATGAAGGAVAVVTADDGGGGKPAVTAHENARRSGVAATPPSRQLGYKSPAGQAAPAPVAEHEKAKKKKKAKKSKEPMPTLVMNPDGTITALDPGEGASGNGGKHEDFGGTTAGSDSESRGNRNGANGTRTRAHGNPPSKGGRGHRGRHRGRGRGATPAAPAVPEVAPPSHARGPKPGKGKGHRGGHGRGRGQGHREHKLALLPLP